MLDQVSDEFWLLRDMNGDGHVDLVVTTVMKDIQGGESADDIYDEPYGYPTDSHWRVYLGGSGGFATTFTKWPLPSGGRTARGFNRGQNIEGANRTSNGGGLANKSGDDAWFLSDIDGDGKPDLVITGTAKSVTGGGYAFHVLGSASSQVWKVYKNTGSGFSTSAVDWTFPTSPAWDTQSGLGVPVSSLVLPFRSHLWWYADMDGDKRPDLVAYAEVQKIPATSTYRAVAPGQPASPHWLVFLNTGSGFSTTATNWTLPQQRGLKDVGLNAFSATGAWNQNGDNSWSVRDLTGVKKWTWSSPPP